MKSLFNYPIHRNVFVYLLVFYSLLSMHPATTAAQEPQQDEISYEVSVSIQLVPFFAFDSDNNPIFDLKEDEIELHVNNRRTGFAAFHRYRMDEETEVQVMDNQENRLTRKPKIPRRLNVIIIDNLISNLNTLNPARKVAFDIVKNSSPADEFIILHCSTQQGMQYVIGPEKDKTKLYSALKAIKNKHLRRIHFLHPNYKTTGSAEGKREMLSILKEIAQKNFEADVSRYRSDISLFNNTMARLKYALRAIKKPKNVFLISAPYNRVGVGQSQTTVFQQLENAAKSVNYGGGILSIINPLPYKENDKRSKNWAYALRFMSEAVKGQYIAGTSFQNIITKLKKSTSAYYEVAFRPIENKQRSSYEIKCKRKGVRIATIGFKEKPTPYRLMSSLEKKLFALDVINRGTWSRLAGPVGVLPIEYNPKTSTAKLKRFRVTLPKVFHNKKMDIFLMNVNPATLQAQSILMTRNVKETEDLEIEVMADHMQYVIFIEPTHPVSIFNRVAEPKK